jgi:hypothetical protein
VGCLAATTDKGPAAESPSSTAMSTSPTCRSASTNPAKLLSMNRTCASTLLPGRAETDRTCTAASKVVDRPRPMPCDGLPRRHWERRVARTAGSVYVATLAIGSGPQQSAS